MGLGNGQGHINLGQVRSGLVRVKAEVQVKGQDQIQTQLTKDLDLDLSSFFIMLFKLVI